MSAFADGSRKTFCGSLMHVNRPQTTVDSEPVEIKKKKLNPVYIAIPSFFDILETICSCIALTLLVASVTQMLKTAIILFTAIFSVLILKMKLYKHHFASLVAIIGGLGMVASAQFIEEGPGGSTGDHANIGIVILGVAVMCIGQCFGALGYILEEKFLSDFEDVHPYLVVGWEGIWGTIIMVIMLTVFQYVPCSNVNLCSEGCIEDSLLAIRILMTS